MKKSQSISFGNLSRFVATLALFSVLFSGLPAQAADAPEITSFTPSNGSALTSVAITGKFFTGATSVSFGAVSTTFEVVSATEITAIVPAGSGQVTISVTTPDGTVTSIDKFTYAPIISSVSPATGPLGGTNTVIITGTNFIGVSGAASVKFGAINASSYTVNSATQITAIAPSNTAGVVNVSVVATGGTATKTSAYTYVSSPPTITSSSPSSGVLAGGTTVVITGTNFFGLAGASAVKFGTKNASSYVVNSPTQITAVTPSGVSGTVNLLITAVDGTATLSSAFTYKVVSSVTDLTAKIYFAPGSSDIRSSQYEAFQDILDQVGGKSNVLITVTSRRWSSTSFSLGKARNTSVIKLLKLIGFEDANYTRFNLKSSNGSSSDEKNNRVNIRVSWSN